jgi:hypothetical protein
VLRTLVMTEKIARRYALIPLELLRMPDSILLTTNCLLITGY